MCPNRCVSISAEITNKLMYLYILIYMCIYTCIFVCIHIHFYLYIYTYFTCAAWGMFSNRSVRISAEITNKLMYLYILIYMYISTCIFVCIHIYFYLYIYTYVHLCCVRHVFETENQDQRRNHKRVHVCMGLGVNPNIYSGLTRLCM